MAAERTDGTWGRGTLPAMFLVCAGPDGINLTICVELNSQFEIGSLGLVQVELLG